MCEAPETPTDVCIRRMDTVRIPQDVRKVILGDSITVDGMRSGCAGPVILRTRQIYSLLLIPAILLKFILLC
jgi:hypothetical protein